MTIDRRLSAGWLGIAACATMVVRCAAQIETKTADVTGVVETVTVGSSRGGVPGHTTYRLGVQLHNDAETIYTIYGHSTSSMDIPAAYQVSSPFGASIGGVNPAFFSMNGQAQYDSWLTVGMTEADHPSALSSIGEDVSSWSDTKDLTTSDGAVFWMNPSHAPSMRDTNGAEGKGTPQGNIVVAQLTVKTGTRFVAKVNAQGHSTHGDNWREDGITFQVGQPSSQGSSSASSSPYEAALQLAKCGNMGRSVNSLCNVQGATNVPSTCASKQCADVYLPFFRECGVVLLPIEKLAPNSAQFDRLYQSCVAVAGRTTGSGKVVDSGVRSKILYDFRPSLTSKSDTVSDWRVTVDGVMGGHSSGTFHRSSTGTCKGGLLSGSVELTHGGFVVVNSPRLQPTGVLRNADGIRVCTKATQDYGVKDGLGDLYKVRLRSGYLNYQADFHTAEAGSPDANQRDNCDGVISTLPFSHFWPARRGQVSGKQGVLDPQAITSMGFDISFLTDDGHQNVELDHTACVDNDPSTICHNNNKFGLCVQWVQYYQNAKKTDIHADHHANAGSANAAAPTPPASSVGGCDCSCRSGDGDFSPRWSGGSLANPQGYVCASPFRTADPPKRVADQACCGSAGGAGAGSTVTVFIIKNGVCSEAAVPRAWASLQLPAFRNAVVGSCSSQGYTAAAGQQTLHNTGAPSDPTFALYRPAGSGH